MKDLNPTEVSITEWAKSLMQAELCTTHGFPEKLDADRIAGEYIDEAIKIKNLTKDPIAEGML